MRIPINSSKANDKLELANQDVDMRILPIPPQTGLDKSKYKKSDADSYNKNTHSSDKSNESTNASRKIIDYSQYLKDAAIDPNQSDLEDSIGKSLEHFLVN